jgi:hypothetical protein
MTDADEATSPILVATNVVRERGVSSDLGAYR